MFTGIVTEIGRIKSKGGSQLVISTSWVASKLKPGDSISVNGVCLTVTDVDSAVFKVDLLRETLHRTNLGRLHINSPVNLELALRVGDKVSGHMVTGHVDGMGRLIRSYKKEQDKVIEIEVPNSIARQLVAKGSITVDGVSLTIVKLMRNRFTVHLIPYTLKYTTLGNAKVGSLLNIEIDIFARYARSRLA